MARLRTIKPEFFTNEDLAECSAFARLLYIGLWCHADRRGILEDRPRKLKLEIFPTDDVSVTKLLDELEKHEFIDRYEVNGSKCLIIPKFQKHQYPHNNEKENGLPMPESMIPVSYKSESTLMPLSEQDHTTPGDMVNRLLVNGSDSKKKPTVSKKTTDPIERLTKIPDNWKPTPALIQYAKDQGVDDVDRMNLDFVDYYVTTAKKFVAWDRVYQKWARNQYSRNPRANGQTSNGKSAYVPPSQWNTEGTM